MKTLLLTGMVVFNALLVGCGQGTATKINLAKWKLHWEGVRKQNGVETYSPLEETSESVSAIEIASGPGTPGKVAALALVRRTNSAAMTFVGGSLNEPNGNLISIRIDFYNTDSNSATFLIGDIALVRTNTQKLRFVAVSKGNSPLVAKLSAKSMEASEAMPVLVKAGETVSLNYCFVVVPDSFPLCLHFGSAKTEIVLKDFQALEKNTAEEDGFTVSLGGALTIQKDIPVEQFEASDTQRGPIVRFVSESFKKGDQLAASGARSLDVFSVDGRLDGATMHEEIPYFEIYEHHAFIPGKLFVLQTITPIKANISVGPHEVTFTSSLKAQKDDVLGAIINNGGDLHSVLSVMGAN